MSNVIKYPFVNMGGKDAVVIRHEDEEKFTPLQKELKVLVRPADEVLAEEEKKKAAGEQARPDAAKFAAGMPVVNFDELKAEKEEEARHEAEKILEEAREQADAIISGAESQAESVRQSAQEEGMRLGREEGMAQAQQEIEEKQRELQELKAAHESEYQQLIQELEPRYADILCSLVQKITGILATERKEVFLHLIHSGMEEIEPSSKYIIRVASKDMMFVESHKKDILEEIGGNVTLDIQEEKGLNENDCIIETDHQMVDCGFHTQLENLVNTLRMLS